MTALRPSLERLAGPALTSGATFLLVFGLSLVMTGLTSTRLFVTHPLSMLVAFTLAQFVLWLVLVFGRWALLTRIPAPAATLTAIPVIVTATALRGVAVAIATTALGVTDDPQWFLRVAGSVFGNSIAVVVGTLVISSMREHRERMGRLLSQQAALRAARDDVREVIKQRQASVIARVRTELLESIESVSTDAPSDAVAAMRRSATDVVRPISHELAEQVERFELRTDPISTRTDWGQVLADATTGRPFRSWAITTGLALLATPWTFTIFPPVRAMTLLLSGFFFVGFSCAVANVAFLAFGAHRGVVGRALVFTGLLVTIGIVSGYGSGAFVGDLGGAPVVAFGDVVLIPLLGWLLAIARAAREQQQRLEEALESVSRDLEWALARASEEQWHQQRALSRALHGPVQSAVGAAALKLELAMRSGIATDTLIAELRASIVSSLDVLDQAPERSIEVADRLDEIARMYSGVCAVRWTLELEAADRLARDRVCAATVVELVTEATQNAVRHGRAAQVDVTIDLPDPQRIRVVVRDDGALGHGVVPGLGTRLLDEVALQWSRTADDDGTVLLADLPSLP